MGFHHVVQAGLELLTSGDPPASASQRAKITGLSHCTQHPMYFSIYHVVNLEEEQHPLFQMHNQPALRWFCGLIWCLVWHLWMVAAQLCY